VSVMPIVSILVLLLLVAGFGWLVYWAYASLHLWLMAIVLGLAAGLFVWLAMLLRLPFPAVAVVLLILAALLLAGCWWMYRAVDGAFIRLLALSAITLAVLFVSWYGLLSPWINAEVVSTPEILNAEGDTGTALVVYHPGKSDFQRDVSYAFAEGLVSHGWRVEITTASSQTPTDLSEFDLLVLGSPTYDWLPAEPVQAYVDRLGDLAGKPVVTIISGAGYTELSQPAMERLVQEAGGQVVKSLAVWSMRPNEDLYGINDATEAMRRAAQGISLP
jgi:hypothetical protein